MKVAAAGNTEIPALLVLESQGYDVSCSDDGEIWRTNKSSEEFIAERPLELLGLVTVVKLRGNDWKAEDSEIARCITRYKGLGV